MLVNHVMSNDLDSTIFEAILGYFRRYAEGRFELCVTAKPVEGASVYHYHRPNLETRLLSPSVTTVHHDLRNPDGWIGYAKFIPRYAEATRVVCLNHGQASLLRQSGVQRLTVIPHGYNDELFPQVTPRRKRDGKVRLGLLSKFYVARFKGEAFLGELVKRLSPAQFAFTLVGERRLATAETLMALGYEVQTYEYLPYHLFGELYGTLDYLLMCSSFEGGPANLAEAFATGVPVLATPVGIAPDYIQHGVNGIILTEDPDIDAAVIGRLANDDDFAAVIEGGARKLRDTTPTWRSVVDSYHQVYQAVIGERHT